MLGAEDGAVQVFVQVGTANAPCDLNQNPARSGFGWDVFNADVVTVVEAVLPSWDEALKTY